MVMTNIFPMLETILPYLYGAFGGLIWALMGAGYHKIGNPDFQFEFKNFLKTILIGVGVGGVAVYFGQPVDVFGLTGMAASITALVDRFLNIVWKKATA